MLSGNKSDRVSLTWEKASSIRARRAYPMADPTGQTPKATPPAETKPGDWSDIYGTVRKWEGFHGQTYKDIGGYSIGYGTAGKPGERITEPAARKAMEEELQRDRRMIEAINPNLSEGSKKALSSLLFNLGGDVNKLKRHGMYEAILANDVEAMKKAHTQFSHVGGPHGKVLE